MIFFVLLLLLKVKVKILLDEKLYIYLKVLFIRIKLFPRPKKATKKKQKQKSTPKKEKSPKGTDDKSKLPLIDNIKIITDTAKLLLKRFAKHLHIKIARIDIKIATGNAASTAIIYGIAAQSMAFLVEILNSITNLDKLKNSYINIEPDYLNEKTQAKADIVFSIRVIGVLDMGIRSLFRYIKLTNRAKSINSVKQEASKSKSIKVNEVNKNKTERVK